MYCGININSKSVYQIWQALGNIVTISRSVWRKLYHMKGVNKKYAIDAGPTQSTGQICRCCSIQNGLLLRNHLFGLFMTTIKIILLNFKIKVTIV